MLRARLKMVKRQRREQVTLAWYVGVFVGMSKPRPLAEVLARLDPPEPEGQLSTSEMMHRMDLWRIAYARHHPEDVPQP